MLSHSMILICKLMTVYINSEIPFFFKQRILYHNGKMGQQHQDGGKLVEQTSKCFHSYHV